MTTPSPQGPQLSAAVRSPWVVALPKAEVHLHLEGCIDTDLVTSNAKRRGELPGPPLPDDTSDRSTLASLLSYLDWSCRQIDLGADLATIAFEISRRASASGARHSDVIVNPTHWPAWQKRLKDMFDALHGGFKEAEEQGFASAALCVSIKRSQTNTQANELVETLLGLSHPRVVALSIDGDESSGSHNERFAEAFATAARGGLRRCAHAGESSGAMGVREAIDILGAERIDHGVRCIEDPGLVSELAHRGIPLDICPTSNVKLGIFSDLGAHPAPALRRAGVAISINTDDPLLYGIDLAGEYETSWRAFGWDRRDLAAVARTSIESCFCDPDRQANMLDDIDRFLAE